MRVEFDTAVAATDSVLSTFRVEVTPRTKRSSNKLVKTAHQLGFTGLQACYPSRLYFLNGRFSQEDAEKIASEILADPVTEQFSVFSFQFSEDKNSQFAIHNSQFTIEVTLLPGVTDPPAENLLHAAQLIGVAGLEQVATGQRYELEGDLDADVIHSIAAEVLANPVIQRFAIDEAISPPFVGYREADGTVDLIDLREADDDELLEISKARRLSMDLYEMQAIQQYYQAEGRAATDVELEMLAQTWSEHCVHKTFRAVIEYDGPDGQETIHGLLNTYIRAATNEVNKPWVRSAFVDNAGIIAFDDTYDLAFKAETHNHPSALEPFGGANTGVGGVVRDVIGVSARPIANTDVLCFGLPDMDHDDLPEGVLHPARIADGVIHGIEDYGNKMGIPTVNGSIHYHPGYTANPLVYCGCLGILPRGSHVTEPQVGDYVVAIGGRTGRDGLRGATFSSMEMDVETSEVAGSSVQIGNPIMEKQTLEVILQARDEKLYTAITDCGAGGFSSAVGEMAETLGADIQLQNITLKYPGLRPWEMWLSEAQERMVLAVPPAKLDALQAICDGQDVELIVLGTFTGNGRLHIQYGSKTVADLTTAFLHDGIPTKNLKAEWKPVFSDQFSVFSDQSGSEPGDLLLKLLGHPDIRSKEDVIRKYDHEVQGGTAVKPLVGSKNNGPSDATVLVPQNSLMEVASGKLQVASSQSLTPDPRSPSPQSPIKGAAISNGINPHYSALDPYNMAWAAIDEALRNAVAVGADPDQVAILDNFCWGNPSLPDRLGSLVRCAQGCYDAALAFGTPFVSGKDSLYNEYTGADGEKHAIPGTLLISALGIVPDVNRTTTMDLKAEGNLLFVVGDTRAELGGSHLHLVGGTAEGGANSPAPVKDSLARMRKLHGAIRGGLVQACHDCAEGGLAVSLAEMCLAGGLGARVDVTAVPSNTLLSDNTILFSESLSRFVVEVKPEDANAFAVQMADVPLAQIGVVQGDALVVNGRSGMLISVGVEELEKAWRGEVAGSKLQVSPPQSPVPSPQPPIPNPRSPKVLILHANGSNRDHDAALACELAGGVPEIVHINQLAAGERKLADYGMLVIPGGFSYGDDLGAGVLWSLDLKYKFGEALEQFVGNGRPVLGICNGFQTLVKAGLLPGWGDEVMRSRGDEEMRSRGDEVQGSRGANRPVTLTFNRSDHFECRWVYLQPNPNSPSLFTQGLTEPIYCPVAHGEGRLAVEDEAVAEALQAQNLIPLTYADERVFTGRLKTENRTLNTEYPYNPNGSILDIAALCNPAGNVMGLMPHPENHIFPWQHPRVHRGEAGMLGLRLFENGIKNA